VNNFINILLWVVYVISLYFSVFLFLVYVDKKNKFREEESSLVLPTEPIITVIVPAYNEEETIIKTLESIYNLDYPKSKLEVIVVNDGSKDKTEEQVINYIKNKPYFKLISHLNIGKAASLNKAISLAKGLFFACLDADSVVDPLTLRRMLSLYYRENDPDLAVITPAMKIYQPKNIIQKVQWIEYLVIILIARISSHLDSLYVAPGPFSIYKTNIIKKLGGFDEKNITEDQEIAYRLQKHHYRIKQCFNAYVYTTAPKKIKPFYRQRRRWYLGSISCISKYRQLIANRRYGDFGMMQMVKNVLGYLLAVTGIIAAIYIFLIPLIRHLKNLWIIDLNIIPYIKNFEINITWLGFLTADFRKGTIIIFIFLIGLYLFYQAHRNANERMLKLGFIPLIPYFGFYYLLKGIILLLSVLEFARSRKLKW